MGNKADYITLINNKLPDSSGGSKIPSKDHRETMHTDDNSIIELVYGDGVIDSDSTETYTTANSNFQYDITFRKVGSQVNMTGRLRANTSVDVGTTVFEITDADLTQESDVIIYSLGIKQLINETISLSLFSSSLKINSSMFENETFNFSITYNTAN